MDYKHILVATDFSDIGKQACMKTARLAQLLNAHLTVLHVIEHFPEDRSETVIPPETTDPQAFFVQQAENELEALQKEIDMPSMSFDVVLTEASASTEIIHYAGERDIDLIVTGTHGLSSMLERLGSTANAVLHNAKVDVLVVRSTTD